MEINRLKSFLFVMPLDHPFLLTADYQNQTALILSRRYQFKILAYKSYEKQIHPWQLFKKNVRNSLFDCKINPNILSVSPLHIIPFERYQSIYSLNRKLSFFLWIILAQLYFLKSKTLLWIFHPRFYWMANICRFFNNQTIVMYDCLDYLSSINSGEEKLLRFGEDRLFQISNLVVANSEFLANLHRKKINNILVSPSGFVRPSTKDIIHGKTQKSGIIGFAGSLNYRLDYDLLYQICKKLPKYQFVFYGPFYTGEEDGVLQVEKKRTMLFSLKNVSQSPFQSRNVLYEKMKSWQIGIIPYNLKVPLNYYCKPLKLYEYFYFGLPVISTPIPSILNYSSIVHFAKNSDEWVSLIKSIYTKKEKFSTSRFKKEEALKNTWEEKVKFILEKL